VPKDYVLSAGALLVTMTDLSKDAGTLGYPAHIPDSPRFRYLHNQRLGKVTVRDGAPADLGYLYYVLCSPAYRHEVLAGATGTTVKHTSPSRIGQFRFRLPPLADQEQIARTLGTLDDKIELNRRTNRTLESIARAIFKSWFVDFDPVRNKMEGGEMGLPSDLAECFPDALAESPIGPIPAGWRVCTLGEIAEVTDCLHSKKPTRRQSGRPLLQLSNIREDGLLAMNDVYWIDDRDYDQWTSKFEARRGDCVITNVGRVGAVAQLPAGTRAALGRNMTGIRCKTGFPYPTFLIQALLSDATRREIREKTDTGTILEALNVRSIPALRCVIPPPMCLEKLEAVLGPPRQLMEALLREASTLADARDSLLPRLLSDGVYA
jgi:Restriction endonuclease S subunits